MTPSINKLLGLRFGSLKLRIAVLYAGLFAIVLGTIIALAVNGLTRFGEANAARDLAANARVFDELLDLRARQMRGSADVLSRDFGFREAVATQDNATIDSALVSLKSRSRTEAAFVIGVDGLVLGTSDVPITSPEALWSPLDRGQQKGIIRIGDKLALAAASRIEAPDLIGWLVLAQALDRAELDRLVQLAAIDLEADVAAANDMAPSLKAAKIGAVFETAGKERFLYQISQIAALEEGLSPRLVLRHSLTASLAQYANLKLLLVLLTLGAIAAVVGLSWRVARSVTGPLQELDEATRLIGEGRVVDLQINTGDEIGRLAVSFNTMVTAIEERERRILHVGLHDDLTSLPNRKLFREQLEDSLRRQQPSQRLMVVYVDLDDFKVVNDTLGHPSGDALLRNVARHLREELTDACIARLGGDEFAILMQNIGADASVAAIAERITACFQRSITIDGHLADCSASIGIAVAPGDGTDATTLMKNADLALYRAKSEGKATYHFFEPDLDEQAQRRRQMELDLRVALRDGQFKLHYQPLYSLVEEKLKGFEALIRWDHPKHGLISPVEFIPLAEETGLILPIGEWVVREACREASVWPADISVAVNVSPKQFATQGLSQTVLRALASSGLSPQRLELEITESIFISNVEKTLSTLHGLRNLGVRIALDDFGTGYSSLSYLRSFPFDKVKIDRSFIQDLDKGGNAHAVIRAITTLADALGMETLAEGVEVQGQLDILRKEGCGHIQGFLFSRPVAASEVAMLIRATGNGIERQVA